MRKLEDEMKKEDVMKSALLDFIIVIVLFSLEAMFGSENYTGHLIRSWVCTMCTIDLFLNTGLYYLLEKKGGKGV